MCEYVYLERYENQEEPDIYNPLDDYDDGTPWDYLREMQAEIEEEDDLNTNG